jgi:SOS response regulatory protein OraA/RecX
LLTLCAAHHRAAHDGTLLIAGGVGKLTFRHADGTLYGSRGPAAFTATQARAFRALRRLGFGDQEVRVVLRQTLEELRVRGKLKEDVEFETVLRHALHLLSQRALKKAS